MNLIKISRKLSKLQKKRRCFPAPLDSSIEQIWRRNKEQAAKMNQNNKQYLLGKNYNMCQQKGVNANNQPYLDQRKKSPINANQLHSTNSETNDKSNQPCSFNLFRSQRSKLIQQQKEKFRHKYSKITSDSKQQKDDSIKLDPLINPSRLCFSKTKVPDDFKIIGDQSKSKILRTKEKPGQLQTNNGYDFQGRLESNQTNDSTIQKHSSDYKIKYKRGMKAEAEPEDSKRANTSDFFIGRRSEVVRNNQDLSLGNPQINVIIKCYQLSLEYLNNS